MRTLVDIPEDDIRWLDRVAEATGRSRAAIVREAVSTYRAQERKDENFDQFFGLWAKHGFAEDGLQYQDRLRAEWDRPWDSEPDNS